MAPLPELFQGLPGGLRALAVCGAGVGAAALWRYGIARLLRLAHLDAAADRLGVSEFLRKGGVPYRATELLGVLGFWSILLASLLLAAGILDLGVVNAFSARLAALVPGLLAGLFVAAVGLAVVAFLANFVLTVARNAGSAHAGILARLVRVGGGVLVLVLALQQLDLDRTLVGTMILLLFGAAAFGLALAFGLGCKDMARDAAARLLKRIREREKLNGHEDLEG